MWLALAPADGGRAGLGHRLPGVAEQFQGVPAVPPSGPPVAWPPSVGPGLDPVVRGGAVADRDRGVPLGANGCSTQGQAAPQPSVAAAAAAACGLMGVSCSSSRASWVEPFGPARWHAARGTFAAVRLRIGTLERRRGPGSCTMACAWVCVSGQVCVYTSVCVLAQVYTRAHARPSRQRGMRGKGLGKGEWQGQWACALSKCLLASTHGSVCARGHAGVPVHWQAQVLQLCTVLTARITTSKRPID